MADSDRTGSTPLEFETDRGASRSIWIAALILLAVIGWMGSGFVLPSEEVAPEATVTTPQPPAVQVRESVAEAVTLTFSSEGQAQPDRDTPLRAEASGNVAELFVSKGALVEQDAPIARLSATRAEADLTQAREEQTRARRELENAQSLQERGIATADRVAEARAAAASADAAVTNAEAALDDLTIRAPFPGRLETLSLDIGEFVSSGEEVGRLVDNRPLTVEIQVPQQALNRIESGQTAEVRFITGETREGTVTFVGSAAQSETRTFLTEIEVPNEDGAIPAGISAEVVIPTGSSQAHFIPPSIVSLDPDGALGVKTFEEGRVVFHPVEIVKTALSGVWVTGLPDNAQIITIGQGFVQNGEEVRATSAPEDASASADSTLASPDDASADTAIADSAGSDEETLQ
ncbi:membrane fusion protein, multidrug efflux system [Palleronia marisminoris]|uniref:Multidrug resistance protein MdtN n=1 Tax=Palleronia marisminoris TaxID=315423 RepID=A0A1Y5TFY1_9RHOB|nr:efflux RND transporter periplasmic adaptor subunit [Palleronia marisminoris]SFH37848.1 membrane fusion protein, multidrug efflux system [Palleronia marisminoris]SLN62836.1 Multidrug resistance protein MdtN [Palleronia marisminoris]